MMPPHSAQQTQGLCLRIPLSCQEALQHTRDSLPEEGFRYLTEMDGNASLKTTLHQFRAQYRIPGADAEPLEQPTRYGQALLADMPQDWGLALPLPSTMDVFVDPHTGETVVWAADPEMLIMEYGQRAMVAEQTEGIRAKLEAAFDRLTLV